MRDKAAPIDGRTRRTITVYSLVKDARRSIATSVRFIAVVRGKAAPIDGRKRPLKMLVVPLLRPSRAMEGKRGRGQEGEGERERQQGVRERRRVPKPEVFAKSIRRRMGADLQISLSVKELSLN